MAEPSESTTQVEDSVRESENLQGPSEDEAGDAEPQQEEAQQPRRGERIRTLTEKGQALQDEKIKGLQQKFDYIYRKWRTLVKFSKQSLTKSTQLSESVLNDILGDVSGLSADVQRIYDDLRRVSTPDQEVRRKVDLCVEVSGFILSRASSRLDGKIPEEEEQDWPEAGSLWNSSKSEFDSVTSILKGPSEHSRASSVKRQEAAADAAASQAVLQVLQEQEREQLEIQRLEAEAKRKIAAQEAAAIKRRLEQEEEEVKRRIKREEEEAKMKAQQEEEHTALQITLDEKRRKLKQLEAVKELTAARARMQVYDQGLGIKEESKGIPCHETVADIKPPCPTSCLPSSIPSAPQPVISSSNQSTVELIKVLADALNNNRIPVPEPSIFSGDPLKYSDWKLSFKTLIDQKNIQDKEKIYYLRKYVSGQAKNALDGYFLLGTESAYAAAWEILEERYGNPFTVAKAYRDKLQAWAKIGPKDSTELREFVDFLRSCEAAMVHVKALEILNDCNENRRILAKLPDWLTARWNRRVMEMEEQSGQFPSFSQFMKFLIREAKIACNPVTSLQALKQGETEKPKQQRQQNVKAKTLTTSSNEETVKTCVFCKKNGHTLHICRKFAEKDVPDRVKFVQAEKLCFGCLKPGHLSKSCNSRSVCDTCNKRHPTCLHEEKDQGEQKAPQVKQSQAQEKSNNQKQEKNKPKPQAAQPKETATASTLRVIQDEATVQTAAIIPVWLSSASQPAQEVLVYALLDSQSDTTFVLSEVADALEADKEQVKLKLSTMTSRTTVVNSQRVKNLNVRGFYSSKRISLPPSYTRDFIPANKTHIPTGETAKAWSHLEHLQDEVAPLQDCEVGLLIGYNCSEALLPREIVSGQENQPYAQRTDLGWSIVGHGNPCVEYGDAIGISHRIVVRQVTPRVDSSLNLKTEVHYVNRSKVKEITPSDIIKVLELDFSERAREEDIVSQDDLKFLSKLRENIRQKDDGHLEMPLPFREERPKLPNNKICAVHRLQCLERKLRKNEAYYKDYVNFMTDIISRGDAEKVPEEEIENSPAWYIPHHGVYHPHKPGRIRVVFDCSAKFQETCLNDHLLTGPDLTNTLVGVLCRFRKGLVAVMCDIERMFHQFHVKVEDQDYLRFLWWESGNLESKPSTYRMKVHLFGAASSPGCANFGLKHLAAQGQGQYGEDTIRFIQRNFYVDDGLASVPTEKEAIHLVKESSELCQAGKLRLHKFVSNNEKVMESIPEEECAVIKDQDMALSLPHMERALGVEWCITSDSFKFRIQVKSNPSTRRGVLSTVASVYDPLGFMAPFVLLGKQILQQMCREKIGWDEELPESLRPQWESWIRDLPNLADMEVRRCYLPTNFGNIKKYELHHFCDASTSGYGVCTYLRAVDESDEVHCSLVMGKSRVSPTKVMTIPRLELSAAVVAVRASDMLRSELEIQDLKEYFWTDSTVVLGYINNNAKRFQVFVANRIQRIKSSTKPEQWAYVASEDNPADHASRGLTAEQLKTSNWFSGPKFLWHKELPVRECKVGEVKDDDPELRKAVVFNTKAKEDRSLLDRLEKFSDWSRVVQAVARLKRRVKEHKGVKQRTNESTSLEERKEAEIAIIKLVQEEAFPDEIKSLKVREVIAKTKYSNLNKLSPVVDEDEVLRVGGRLSQAALHPHIKHPAILPKNSHISALLIKHFHEKVHHQGRGLTLNELRANGWWILGSSSVVSSHIFKCVKCRKYRRCTEEQKMGNLPQDRMETTPPFTYTGIDCFGPIYVKDGRKEVKRYGLLFTCLCSRAIHIEVLDDMTTDAFINALRAFIAIRGNVRQLRSDQGTNFIGARREFTELMKGMEGERVKALGCEFLMNPPAASHMGGVWERQIRTIRSVLTAILDESAQRLDSSSLRTFLYEVMAVVNSRPLTVEHLNDPSAPEPLTPNHILTMKSTIILPPPGQFVKEDLYLQKRWRKVQYLANEFWIRWKKEYLLSLQPRQKWQKNRRNMKVNDIVLLQDEQAPRNEWKLAKIAEVYPESDDRVRKVRLLVSDTTFDGKGKPTTKTVFLDRPIHKLVTLIEAD